jgi:hypothetical protein
MGNIRFTNNASAELASGITNSQTTITVEAGKGALFPVVSGATYAIATIESDLGVIEIVRITGVAGDVLTVTRAQEGTIGVAFSSGSRIECRLTAAIVGEFYQKTGDTLLGNMDCDGFTLVDPVLSGMVTGSFKISNAGAVVLRLENLSAGVDEKLFSWQNDTSSGDLLLYTRTDADALGRKLLQFKRTGIDMSELAFGDSGHNPTWTFLGTGKLALGGLLELAGVLELGHATDTTLARVSPGVVSLEGSNLVTEASLPARDINTDQLVTDITTDGNDHTVVASDRGSIRRMTQAGGTQTVTVNSDALGGNGRAMLFIREGTAAVTFAAGGGVAIETKAGLSITVQNGAAALIQKTTNIFHLIGDV